MKVRKKPVIVEARICEKMECIRTANGDFFAQKGDIVLTAPDGDTWFVKPDIFKKTYEIVEE